MIFYTIKMLNLMVLNLCRNEEDLTTFEKLSNLV